MAKDIVSIGCAAGFWGDSPLAARQLVERGDIDFLVFDYLAEVTMSILARARARTPELGYATDFAEALIPDIVGDLAARKIRLVCNAGGVNPRACRDAVANAARAAGLDLKIAVVLGDDLMPGLAGLRRQPILDMFSGAPLPDRLLSANAYLGALPIARALDAGADIVITGRCVDSALALGPLIHAFGWAMDDHARLAAGTLAGHIIECGAQSTGGLFTDWQQVAEWSDIGYPVVECRPDGRFVVTKPAGTGGLVSPATVAEQIVYEIGDPTAYHVPDVACDFSQVRLTQQGADRVLVEGASGRPPTPHYKVSATSLDGYRLSTTLTIGGREAAAKARSTGEALLARARRAFAARGYGDFSETNIELLGAEHSYGPHARHQATREVVLRLSARHLRREALELLAREAASPVTSMAPGTTGYIGGRPAVQSAIRLHSFLLAKSDVPAFIDLGEGEIAVPVPPSVAGRPESTPPVVAPGVSAAADEVAVPLFALAHGRSGDKGNHANIGIIARRPELVPLLRERLTSAVVADYFRHLCAGPVTRYELPGIGAFNFLLEDALGGGGVLSLRNDPQGKCFAQMLLDLELRIPRAAAESLPSGALA
jgi:Acyclic terpene utilisation family protein AtuA